eukprot:3730291-Amphidinium_carterae.1
MPALYVRTFRAGVGVDHKWQTYLDDKGKIKTDFAPGVREALENSAAMTHRQQHSGLPVGPRVSGHLWGSPDQRDHRQQREH